MRFLALATLFAATALAAPGAPSLTQNTALSKDTCGSAQLSCCDSEDNSVSITKEDEEGLLHLLGGGASVLSDGVLGKYSGCSELIPVNALIGAEGNGLISGQCNNHVACCNAGPQTQDGVVNAAIPCIPVNVL
ncbi:hypothetical protein BDV19DRAFT_366085 [Aspergillus venezuelensis]